MVKFIDLEHLVSDKTDEDRPVQPRSKPGDTAIRFRQMEADPDLDLPDLAVMVKDKNDLYTEGLRYVSQVFAAIRKRKKFALDPGFRIIRQMIQSRSTQRSMFIRAIHQDDIRAYLAQKSVNVSLFSVRMGEMLGYDEDQQLELGMAGLLHEIGMALIPEKFLFSPGPLPEQEVEVIRQHSEFGYQILKSYSDQYPYLAEVALQIHERIDGSGYPQGLRGDEIHEYAQIIGLVDTYEALCHSRPYRDRFHHFYAIKEIIRTCKVSFQRKHLKALLNTVSIFPLSTLVRLNSNAIGRVIQTFPDRPMRPRLRIEFDSQGRKVLTERIVHLPDNPLLYIVDSISEDEIPRLGHDTPEVVRSRTEPPASEADTPLEKPAGAPDDTPVTAETGDAVPPKQTAPKRTGWFRRALGLGALLLVAAWGFWYTYWPGATTPPRQNLSKPIQKAAPTRVPVMLPRDNAPSRNSTLVPLVHRVPAAPVARAATQESGHTGSRLPPPPTGTPPTSERASSDAKASPESHTPGPVRETIAPVPSHIDYPYSVLLGSFRLLDSAENALADYRRKGYPVYRVTVNLGKDGVWHRLFAGYFSHIQDAEAFIAAHQLEGALAKRTRFAAMLGAFPSERQLARLLLPLREEGFSPYIIEDDTQGYRVMVGAFYTKSGAVQQVSDLAKKGFAGQVVER